MRDRRDANRTRVKDGLKDKGKPSPLEFVSQGSYAMLTMVQDVDNDYDIDDGVYFDKDVLVGDRGGELTALAVRQMVRDAVDDGSFNKAPEVLKNCVRVYYKGGYHVDIPAYRKVTSTDALGQETVNHELASSDWKRSDAKDVTAWFNDKNTKLSVDDSNGRQLRRLVRLLKKFSRSRASWKDVTLSGFGITALIVECYRGNATREDVALYETMKAIRDRLTFNLTIAHPVTPNTNIVEADSPKAKHFGDKLTEAIDNLDVLHKADCSNEQALKAWGKVFSSTFFPDLLAPAAKDRAIPLATALIKSGVDEPRAVRKEGGGQYA